MAETVSIVANDHCTLNIDVAGEYNVQLASVQGNYGVYLLTTDDWISFTVLHTTECFMLKSP